ncbi:hypothetical protein ACHAXT_011601 [Thalassiosira profunda]
MATAAAAPPVPSGGAVPLRRATYVNVDKLVRSQYDVDLPRLTSELAHLKKDAPAVEGDDAEGTPPKPNAWATSPLSVLPSGPIRGPLPPHKFQHQSRLQPPREGFNLCLLVGKVELVVDKLRVDGSRVLVAEVEVGDESGSISLRARDDQIDLLRQVSDDGGAIVLRNCTMELYQGKHLRLAVSKWGKMQVYPDGIDSTPDPPSSMNRDLNFSLVDLNVVATPKIPEGPIFPMPVATVHHKPQKQHQKYFKESQGRGTPLGRRGSGGGHYTYPKKKDSWQHQRHQQQRRPRSGSYQMSPGGGQYTLQHQHSSGSGGSPPTFVPQQMHYPQYSDAGSVYSYQSQPGSEPPAGSPHRPYLPNDHYKRQQHILYQEYELQQRMHMQEFHQRMHLLQQQQESQRQMMGGPGGQASQQPPPMAHSSLIPDLSRAESHESSGEYPASFPPPAVPGSFPPPTPTGMQPHPPSPQHAPNAWGGAGGAGQQPWGSQMGVPTYAPIISPPMSPAHSSQPPPAGPPQAGRLDDKYNAENQE